MRTSRNLNICKTQAGAPAANSVLQIETIRQKSSMSLECDDSTGSEIVLYVLGKPPRLTHAICTRTGSSYNASTASNTAPTQETLNTTSIFPALTPLTPIPIHVHHPDLDSSAPHVPYNLWGTTMQMALPDSSYRLHW